MAACLCEGHVRGVPWTVLNWAVGCPHGHAGPGVVQSSIAPKGTMFQRYDSTMSPNSTTFRAPAETGDIFDTEKGQPTSRACIGYVQQQQQTCRGDVSSTVYLVHSFKQHLSRHDSLGLMRHVPYVVRFCKPVSPRSARRGCLSGSSMHCLAFT